MLPDELVQFGAVELARLIRSRQVDPVEVVEAHISQIEMVNPTINALVTATFEDARKAARRIRESAKPADLPLLGVPFTVKDSLPVAGVRCTAGSTYHRDDIAVQGGEAALVASCGSPLGLGADLGGSIRIPAAFCGVVGLKPTGGRIPTSGCIPNVPASLSHWITVGPIARRVEDVAAALSVLSDTPTRDYRSIGLAGRRLLIPRFMRMHPVSREVTSAIENAARALRDIGMVEEHLSLPLAKVGMESAGMLCREWVPEFRVALGGGKRIRLWEELAAHYRGSPRLSGACVVLLAMTYFAPFVTGLGYGRLRRMKELRNFILHSMGEGSVLLWPVYPTTAPKHGFAWKPNKGPNYTLVFNCLGFPAVAIPVNLLKGGLPLSVQVIGQPTEDETVLAVAAVLEKAFGGWRMPPTARA